MKPRKYSDLDDIESAKDRVLDTIKAQISDEISGDSIGIVQRQNGDESDYELIKFKDLPFTLQEDNKLFKRGQLVCKVVYM